MSLRNRLTARVTRVVTRRGRGGTAKQAKDAPSIDFTKLRKPRHRKTKATVDPQPPPSSPPPASSPQSPPTTPPGSTTYISAIADDFYFAMDSTRDPRGRVERVKTEPKGQGSRMHLIAADSARYHLSHLFRPKFDYEDRLTNTSAGETLRLYWPTGVPIEARDLLILLTKRIAVPLDGLGRLHLVIALDRYKIVDPSIPATKWNNTRVGAAVHAMKYRNQRSQSYAAHPEFSGLVLAYAEVLSRHPAYKAASTLVSVPGSGAPGTSLSEAITRELARRSGKELCLATCPPHRPRKGPNPPNLTGQVSITQPLSGSCIVIDDVLHTGHTLNETARAALSAGATTVYGLVAAKTMRS